MWAKNSSNQLIVYIFFRYAIGHAERSGPFGHTGWLAHLANATDQPYLLNKTYPGGPSIKVSNNYLNYFILFIGAIINFIKGRSLVKT